VPDTPSVKPLAANAIYDRSMADAYDFDRFLRYDELVAWLDELADTHPELVNVET
jgi:hypothetical protein